jgi:predicted NUDIX family phosphoesterase
MQNLTERVLVVPRWLFESAGELEGFTLNTDPYLKMLDHRRSEFIDRESVEHDDSFKQVISFILIKRGEELLVNVRSLKAGDERLLGATSIGIGGHINFIDAVRKGFPIAGRRPAFLGGSKREFDEEVKVRPALDSGFPMHTVGVVNDDMSPIGRCHFGIVSVVEIPEGSRVNTVCDSVDWVQFRKIESLKNKGDSDWKLMESWSTAIFERIDELLSALKQKQDNYFADLII